MNKYAIIVAGGSGTRMGAAIPKQFLLLHGKPLLMHTVTAFLHAFPDLVIVIVLPEAYLQMGEELITEVAGQRRFIITTGGQTRFHSVKNGLRFVPDNAICFIHDAVRCLVSIPLIRRCYEATLAKGNAIPAIASTDSLRVETVPGTSVALDRSTIRMIQTPQTFQSGIIKKAFEQDYDPSFTDEAGVAEKSGIAINLVEGEPANIKITTPLDLLIAEQILSQKAG